MCIGKRFAELEMKLLAMELLRKYRVEWVGEDDMGSVHKIVNAPSKELLFRFVPL